MGSFRTGTTQWHARSGGRVHPETEYMGEAEAGDSQLGCEQIENPRDFGRSLILSVAYRIAQIFFKSFNVVVL